MANQNQRIIVVDSQKLSSIQSCMQHYKLAHIDGYEPHVKPDFFERGSLIHDGLQVYYNLKRYKSRWQTNNHSHKDIVSICERVMRYKAVLTALDGEDIELNIRAFREYTEYFQNDGWDNILAVEQVGSFILWENEDLIIVYEMKIDLIISTSQIALLPVDHKSGSRRVDPNEMSNQFMGYCVGLKTNNLYQNQIGFQKTLKPAEKFQRHLLSFNDDRLAEWKDESAWWIRHGLDLSDRRIFPHNLTSCDKFSGCIYRPVCKSEPILRQIKLSQGFDKRESKWDVGKGL